MVGTVNMVQTLELLLQIILKGFDGVIYFDIFPDVTGLDRVQECENNIAIEKLSGEWPPRGDEDSVWAVATSPDRGFVRFARDFAH